MYNTQDRVDMAMKRAKKIQKKERNILLTKMYILSVTLGILDIYLISTFTNSGESKSKEEWMFGATMLFSDAGGYVLVAVCTFVIAVIITVICMKKHQNSEEDQENKEKN